MPISYLLGAAPVHSARATMGDPERPFVTALLHDGANRRAVDIGRLYSRLHNRLVTIKACAHPFHSVGLASEPL